MVRLAKSLLVAAVAVMAAGPALAGSYTSSKPNTDRSYTSSKPNVARSYTSSKPNLG